MFLRIFCIRTLWLHWQSLFSSSILKSLIFCVIFMSVFLFYDYFYLVILLFFRYLLPNSLLEVPFDWERGSRCRLEGAELANKN